MSIQTFHEDYGAPMYQTHLPVVLGGSSEDDIIPLMTLIIAAKGKDGIVIAGDKRSVYFDNLRRYKDNNLKVVKINKQVGIAMVGDGDDAKPIMDLLFKDPISGDVNEVAQRIQAELVNYMSKWVNNTDYNPEMLDTILLVRKGLITVPSTGFIIAGYTKDNQKKLISVNTKNVVLRPRNEDYYFEGITDIAHHIFSEEYQPEMSLKELEKIAVKSIQKTAKLSFGVSKEYDFITLSLK